MEESKGLRPYNVIRVTEPVSIRRVEKVPSLSYAVLILGPTGAGKSTFIKALGATTSTGSSRSLNISSNSTDGFTHSVSAYEVTDVWSIALSRLYLVDSPGFADPKISETEIVAMLSRWLETNQLYFSHILFLTPITSIRLAATHRKVLKTFQALTGLSSAKSITIVTTMWDSICGEGAMKRAKATLDELEGVVWKEFIDRGAQITRFYNTQQSALSILDESIDGSTNQPYHIERMVETSEPSYKTPYFANLLDDLQSRIQALRLQRENILSQMAETTPTSESTSCFEDSELLRDTLIDRLDEVERCIGKFEQQLHEFLHPQGVDGPSNENVPISFSRLSAVPIPEGDYNATGHCEVTKPSTGSGRTARGALHSQSIMKAWRKYLVGWFKW